MLEQQLLQLLEKEQLYLEPKLSLADLATRLDAPKNRVSKIINATQQRSFYDLVNGYRVEHLKQQLNNPENAQFTILALALNSGFNSKASLNRIFKNITGLTPRQYLDQRAQATH